MKNSGSEIQVQMVWPEELLNSSPAYKVPFGYQLRTYQEGDEDRFFLHDGIGWMEELG